MEVEMITDIFETFTRNWWVLLLRGLFAILFGVMAFTMPGMTILTLTILFGIYVFADGVTEIVYGFGTRTWSLVIAGILGILIGAYAFMNPASTAAMLLLFIGAWIIVRGFLDIIGAFYIRKQVTGEWMLIVGGLLSVLIGLAVIAYPAAAALTMAWLIGLYAIVFGIVMMIMAFRLRGLRTHFHQPHTV
jgi:uncharacterized membrane protein HdeD (DUF308 family)